jgi:hypothetical protein
MKRLPRLLFLAAFTLFAVPAQSATREFLCGFTGFDYVLQAAPGAPEAIPTPFLALGDEYCAVGFITSMSPLLAGATTAADEHTFHLAEAMVTTPPYWDGEVLEVIFAPHARYRIYEDAVHNADYGINPPNATSPPTFVDGTLILGADITNLVLVYDYTTNQGNFECQATLDEGSQLGIIPVASRAGWVLSGTAGRPNATIPEGYVNQLSGEVQIPTVTPAAHRSWGSIKTLYR